MDDIYYPVAHRPQSEIDALKKRYEVFDTASIPVIFKKALGLTATTWTLPETWSTSHVVYIVETKERPDPLVLRANIGFVKPEAVLAVEKLITNRVKAAGIPTNSILHVDISRKFVPFDYQIQEMLTGHDLEDHFKGTKEQYDSMSFDLGVMVGKLHTLTVSGYGRFSWDGAAKGKLAGAQKSWYEYVTLCLHDDVKFLVDQEVIDVRKGDRIFTIFEEHKTLLNLKQSCIVHHDLADHNIMFAGNRISGIFDWEAAVAGDCTLDLASCPTWKTHYPREEKLIEGFRSVAPLPDHFKEKMNLYRLRTMLWKTVYAMRARILTPARRARFTAALASFGL